MILSKRPEVDRFLSGPDRAIRAAVIYGRDRSGVHERADLLTGKVVRDPNDPFDVSILSEADIDSDSARLEDALTEQDRLGIAFDAAVGTSTEFGAYVRLQRASEQVAARQTWLNWVDHESYRGVHAGPFELAADRQGRAGVGRNARLSARSPRAAR